MSQTQTSPQFEIGHKVTWQVGKDDHPIICEGLFLGKKDDNTSNVKILIKNFQKCIFNLEVSTHLLKLVTQ